MEVKYQWVIKYFNILLIQRIYLKKRKMMGKSVLLFPYTLTGQGAFCALTGKIMAHNAPISTQVDIYVYIRIVRESIETKSDQ